MIHSLAHLLNCISSLPALPWLWKTWWDCLFPNYTEYSVMYVLTPSTSLPTSHTPSYCFVNRFQWSFIRERKTGANKKLDGRSLYKIQMNQGTSLSWSTWIWKRRGGIDQAVLHLSHYEYYGFWRTTYPSLSKLGCFSPFQSVQCFYLEQIKK